MTRPLRGVLAPLGCAELHVLHGHLHAPSDYIKEACRVVANPLGYARKGEQAAFRKEFCVEIQAKQYRVDTL